MLGSMYNIAGLVLLVISIYVTISAKRLVDQSDDRYRLITENISDVVFLMDLNFNWL